MTQDQKLQEHEQNLRDIGYSTALAVQSLKARREALQREVLAAIDDGMTEAQAARCAGLTRQTVRRWLGKAV